MTTKGGEVDHLQARPGNTYEMVSCIMQKAARAQSFKGSACLGQFAQHWAVPSRLDVSAPHLAIH